MQVTEQLGFITPLFLRYDMSLFDVPEFGQT